MAQVVREKILSQSCGTSQRDHEIKAIIDQQHHHQEQNRKSCLLIHITIPTEGSTPIKVTEKLSKYKDLEIKIEIE